jgi:hypothetical protein
LVCLDERLTQRRQENQSVIKKIWHAESAIKDKQKVLHQGQQAEFARQVHFVTKNLKFKNSFILDDG